MYFGNRASVKLGYKKVKNNTIKHKGNKDFKIIINLFFLDNN